MPLLLELQQHGYKITANNTPAVTPTVRQLTAHRCYIEQSVGCDLLDCPPLYLYSYPILLELQQHSYTSLCYSSIAIH